MTTAEAIEGITDAGKFEILATRVLREKEEDCRFLEHMGVNAAGKTIKNPIDCFCGVPGTDPPRFVMAAFTTEEIKSLDRKWLFDHTTIRSTKKVSAKDDGDLIKASQRAEVLRKDYPGATFVLYLCTNKQPDDQLITKVFGKGHELGLKVRFITQSYLRDFLDVNPDGQWLRKEHLGIQAERLSPPLLRDLSAKSLQQYGKFLITPPEDFITTSSERALTASLVPSRSIYVVTGASGSGKSVTCYQVLRNHLNKGGFGLWIPGEIAACATSLEEAIGLTLRSLHPTIEPTSGTVALRLGSLSQRLVVVVDDINRRGSPSESLRKLLAWTRPLSDGKNGAKNNISSPCAILVPAWDIFWTPDKQFSSESWMARVPVNKMEEVEAIACLATALGPHLQRFAEADQRQIVTALGHDPILIALFAYSVTDSTELHIPFLANEVIDRFVQTAEVEATNLAGHLQVEYDLALIHLAAWILNQKVLYPRWEDVQQGLLENEVQAIRELVRIEKICRVMNRGGEYRFEFRHDRILEHFLVLALQPMLANLESNVDVLTDPFYTSFIGRTLALSQPSDGLLGWFQQHAPLALISSLHFLPALQNHTADRIAAAATYWLELASRDHRTPPVVLFEAYRLLEEMDTPRLHDVTKSLARHRLVACARLANGDAAAGAVEFSDTRWFAPAVNSSRLDAVFSRAIHRYKQRLITDCAEMLKKANLAEADRRGALILAGFIADAALAVPIQTAWNLSTDKSRYLLPALWAGLRCAAAEPASVLDGMMAALVLLPNNDTGSGFSMRAYIMKEIQFAVQRGIPESVLKYLIAKAKTNEDLRWPITIMLEHLDQPLAVKFLVEEAADTERRIKGTDKSSIWLMTLLHHWDPTMAMSGRRLSEESIQAIRSCWDSETADPQLRETAFKFWVNAVDDLDILRSIPTDHPQFERVLWRRAILGDFSTIPLIKLHVAVDNKWLDVIRKVWAEQFRDVLDNVLLNLKTSTPTDYTGGNTHNHYMLAELLRDIPIREAEPLLIKHWSHLKFSQPFVQAALYIGSPECVALATNAIAIYPSNIDPCEHIDYFFGFHVSGLRDHVELRHLEVLLPYLRRLSDMALSDMAEFCERRSNRDWSRTYLKPEFDRRRALLPQVTREKQTYIERMAHRHFPSDADLLQELDWIEQQGDCYHGHIYYWSEEFEQRQDDHARWQHILNEWLLCNPTVERFRLFADAILEQGTRSDIDLLYKHMISGDPNEIERLRANAIFGIKRRTLR